MKGNGANNRRSNSRFCMSNMQISCHSAIYENNLVLINLYLQITGVNSNTSLF